MENMGGQPARAGSPALAVQDVVSSEFDEGRMESYLRSPVADSALAKAPVGSPQYGFVPGIPLRAEGGK